MISVTVGSTDFHDCRGFTASDNMIIQVRARAERTFFGQATFDRVLYFLSRHDIDIIISYMQRPAVCCTLSNPRSVHPTQATCIRQRVSIGPLLWIASRFSVLVAGNQSKGTVIESESANSPVVPSIQDHRQGEYRLRWMCTKYRSTPVVDTVGTPAAPNYAASC